MVRSMVEIASALTLGFVFAIVMAGCSDRPREDAALNGWDGSIPSQIEQMPSYDQLPAYKGAAYAGSGRAAMAVANFYMKADKSGTLDLYWTIIAAENGDSAGQYNLGMRMLDKKSLAYSPHRAKYWLRLSAQQGNPYAKELLGSQAASPVSDR